MYILILILQEKMVRSTIILILIALFITSLNAQTHGKQKHTRHRFAQMNIGVDTRYFFSSNSKSFYLNENDIFKTNIDQLLENRVTIGGFHFWGYTDFYISFNFNSIGTSNYRNLIETGADLYPFRLRDKNFSPFIGFSWQTSFYQQGNGPNQLINNSPIKGGISYLDGNHHLKLSGGINIDNDFDYYINREIKKNFKSQPYWISLGYKYIFDTTISAEESWQSGKTEKLTNKLDSLGALNGFTLGIGISSSIFTENSGYNLQNYPFAGSHEITNIFPEFGIGYYFSSSDIQLNISIRQNSSLISGYGYKQELNRSTITLEGFKFLFDYHGFVPFVGPSISYESLNFYENDAKFERKISEIKFKPGFTFGWDIRPNKIQSFYLRTNLRWHPNININIDSKRISFSQLEINFIELIVFPERLF